MGFYLRPRSVDEAVGALAGGHRTIIAGGTDHYPARVGRAPDEDIVDISGITDLTGVAAESRGWRIGAATTWSQIIDTDLPPLFDCLKLAAREVGGLQIQNAGTIGGNVCNASPAADGVPALMAMNAWIELRHASGTTSMPVRDFVTGNRQTWRRPGDLATAFLVPKPKFEAISHFAKLGARRYLVISIVMVAIVLETDNDVVTQARVAIGACSSVARHLRSLENRLVGRRIDENLGSCVGAEDMASLSPIDDVRASGAYRLDAALTATRRALNEIGARR